MRGYPLKARVLLSILVLWSLQAAAADWREFRSFFFSSLKTKLSSEEKAQLLYAPSPAHTDLFQDSHETNPQAVLEAITKRFQAVTPGELYLAGRNLPEAKSTDVELLLKQKSITVVLVPGIFGEFIATRPFEEVFRTESSAFASTWRTAYRKVTRSDLAWDGTYSLKLLKRVWEQMDRLVHCASIDDADGQPLVRVVLLNAPRLSLETLGKSADHARDYLRRLDKTFEILGPDASENIVFLGYSRGTITGLEMLSQMRAAQPKPWHARVRGLVSLGGVTFGSDLADAAHTPGSVSFQQLSLLTGLAHSLTPVEDLIPRDPSDSLATRVSKDTKNAAIVARNTATVTANTGHWLKFAHQMSTASSDVTLVTTLLSAIVGIDPRLGSDWSSQTRRFQLLQQFVKGMQSEFGMTSKEFGINPQSFFTDYNLNIKRFQKLVESVGQGVKELTTESRLAWWKDPKHLLPTEGIRYYTVAAAMIDGQFEAGEDLKAAANSAVSYDSGSLDDTLLRKNAEDFRLVSGLALNDSQVAVSKVFLWPELAESLNPIYRESDHRIDSTLLAVLGTHHWGIALEKANAMPNRRNPFPRVALLQAIAASAASDLQSK